MINEFDFTMPDEFWRYSFGTWTQHPRLDGETDEQVFARIKAETQQAAADAIALIDEERQKRADLHALLD